MEWNGASSAPLARWCFSLLSTLTLSCGDTTGAALDPVEQRAQELSSNSTRAFVGMDLGDFFGCLVRPDGRVVCWGRNNERQLGVDGADVAALLEPAVVGAPTSPVSNAVALGVGEAHACTVRSNGEVWCWGRNTLGQSGQPNQGTSRSPLGVPDFNATNAAQTVTAGLSHSCALLASGQVRCWGSNAQGQLGRPSAPSSTHLPQTVETLANGVAVPLENVVQVEAAGNQTCARTGDGRIFCWGTGVLAAGSGQRAVHLNNASQITDLAVGDEHVCIRGGEGSVWCRGGNVYGQLGRGVTSGAQSDFAPVLIPGGATLQNVSTVFGGRYSTCAILADGTAKCWGASFQGRLGTGSAVPNSTFAQPMVGVVHATAGATGNTHTCVVAADFAGLRCTGSDWFGELGDGAPTGGEAFTPVAVQLSQIEFQGTPPFQWAVFTPEETQGRASIAGGGSHFCAIVRSVINTSGGVESKVYCWGDNSNGQCGPRRTISADGGTRTVASEWAPRPVALVGVPAAVSAGYFYSCALLTDGRVQCWGYNTQYQMGPGSTDNLVPPTLIPGVTNAVAVSAGHSHACAVIADGTVRCWGANGFAQLGRGIDPPDSPSGSLAIWRGTGAAVTGLDRVIQIAAGDNHTCALRADASIRCWGRFDLGAVGPGDPTQYLVAPDTRLIFPVPGPAIAHQALPTTPLPNIADPGSGLVVHRVPVGLSAALNSNCLRYAHGAVECWGERALGRLGDDPALSGGGSIHLRPYSQANLPQGIAMTTSAVSGCVLRRDGTVACWGSCAVIGTGSTCPAVGFDAANRNPVVSSTTSMTLSHVVSVALASSGTACGMRADGSVQCWGSNAQGQLGAAINPGMAPTGAGLHRTFAVPVNFNVLSPI